MASGKTKTWPTGSLSRVIISFGRFGATAVSAMLRGFALDFGIQEWLLSGPERSSCPTLSLVPGLSRPGSFFEASFTTDGELGNAAGAVVGLG